MDLRSAFGMHTVPFTREIRIEDQLVMPMHEEALEGLLRALDGRMSAALIAPAGTGKTALLRRLVARLPEARYQVRTVKVTGLSKRDLCREIAAACGVPSAGSYPALVRRLTERFEATLDDGGVRPVLVLDEAHELRPEVLSMLRLLTNFKMDSRLVLSLVLSGQPPLATLLRRDDQEAIARRLAFYATLRTLSDEETRAYVEHRCAIAGAARSPFDLASVDALYEMSRGNLRAIDSLALEALGIAARAKVTVVCAGHIVAARKVLYP
jgi:type II secretory pathway predicted ATPase ExeA